MAAKIIYLECKDSNSNKFYEIQQQNLTVFIRYGRIGSNGVSSSQTFNTLAEANKHVKLTAGEKRKKGYSDVDREIAEGSVANEVKSTSKKSSTAVENNLNNTDQKLPKKTKVDIKAVVNVGGSKGSASKAQKNKINLIVPDCLVLTLPDNILVDLLSTWLLIYCPLGCASRRYHY